MFRVGLALFALNAKRIMEIEDIGAVRLFFPVVCWRVPNSGSFRIVAQLYMFATNMGRDMYDCDLLMKVRPHLPLLLHLT